MEKVLLIGPNGQRWIEAGQPFKFLPGEKVYEDSQGHNTIIPDEAEEELHTGIQSQGIQWGDAVARLTKVFGIKPCSKCEQRRQIMNHARELGIKETLSKLKETI